MKKRPGLAHFFKNIQKIYLYVRTEPQEKCLQDSSFVFLFVIFYNNDNDDDGKDEDNDEDNDDNNDEDVHFKRFG